VDGADGRLGAKHWRGKLFKQRYGKSSVNHGVSDPILGPHPISITSVDNPAVFAPAVKNQVHNVDNPADLGPGFKNVSNADNPANLLGSIFFFLLRPIYPALPSVNFALTDLLRF